VRLSNVLVYECRCGVRIPEIPAISDLHCLIALDLLRKPSLLVGEEIRFLRKIAGLSQKELAELMGVTPTLPSKWERDGASNQTDRLLRTVCLLGMIENINGQQRIELLGDVRDILRSIKDKDEGPRKMECKNDPARATDHGGWFLPSAGNGDLLQVN
jgi:transcriptional regulator with XRE-family HTH domain